MNCLEYFSFGQYKPIQAGAICQVGYNSQLHIPYMWKSSRDIKPVDFTVVQNSNPRKEAVAYKKQCIQLDDQQKQVDVLPSKNQALCAS